VHIPLEKLLKLAWTQFALIKTPSSFLVVVVALAGAGYRVYLTMSRLKLKEPNDKISL